MKTGTRTTAAATPKNSYTMRARAETMATTRERIVREALTLAVELPYEDITLTAIAEAAGVSHQTVLNHYASKEGVAAAAAELLARETAERRQAAVPGDLPGAMAILIDEYERFGDANARWAMSSERLGSLARFLEEARAGHQAWLEHICAASLPRPSAARRRAIQALHAATDVYTWKLLRRDLKLTRADTERVMMDLARGILGPASSASGAARARTR
jgi:AcrR family transcriptional regulator